MSDHRRLPVLGALTIAMFFVLAVTPPGTAHAVLRSTPADAAPPTEPETSEPPTTEPETSEPATTEPATEPAESGDDGDDIETTAAVLGILGFIALVGVAAWWMVRLGNDDDAPHPRQPSLDDDPPPQQDLM